jgi:pSer/pThr/pTyr-binding forkhead associated (FHA) protein
MKLVFLKVNQGAALLREKLDCRPYTCIGRSRNMDIPIPEDDTVSRKHAAIISADFLGIIDLKSKNGTYLNGVKIESIKPISPGDVISVGQTDLVLIYFQHNKKTQKRRKS